MILFHQVPESCCRIQDGEQADCNDKVEGAGNKVQPQLAYSKVQGSAKRWSPGCVNAAGKARLK